MHFTTLFSVACLFRPQTFMRASGVPPHLIGLFLGHGDSRMAERVYGQITPDELAHLLAEKLERPRRATARRQKAA